MTMRREAQITVPQVLERHWLELLHETSVSEYVFATNVREHYERTVPPPARTIEWSQHPDPTTRMKRDAEKLRRWFDDDVRARFPAEAIEAFIAAFPMERRFALQQELAARQGLLAVPMPQARAGADAANLGRIGKETGKTIIVLSRMLDDGHIDKGDAALANEALRDIDKAVAVLIEMRERVERQALGKRDGNGG